VYNKSKRKDEAVRQHGVLMVPPPQPLRLLPPVTHQHQQQQVAMVTSPSTFSKPPPKQAALAVQVAQVEEHVAVAQQQVVAISQGLVLG